MAGPQPAIRTAKLSAVMPPKPIAGRRGALQSALVLALQLVLLVVPAAHEIVEGTRLHGARDEAGVAPACPPDCTDHGHRHHAHDASTCAICHAFRAPTLRQQLAGLAPLTVITSVTRTWAVSPRSRLLAGPASQRGPPVAAVAA